MMATPPCCCPLRAIWRPGTRNFDGILHVVFQPAEEGQAGARAMLDDGFRTCSRDAINWYVQPARHPGRRACGGAGYALASSDTCIIKIQAGTGGHGAMPHVAVDVVLAASSTVVALHSIVARNVNPIHTGVITGAIHSGEAPNDARRGRTALHRARLPARGGARPVERRIRRGGSRRRPPCSAPRPRCTTTAVTRCSTTMPRKPLSAGARDHRLAGTAGMAAKQEPCAAREDFAFFLEKVPGCYVFIGNGEGQAGGCMTHNAAYDFNDRVLSTGPATGCVTNRL